MKTKINSINNWSVKSIIAVTILSAMFCGIGAKASNKPTVASNAVKSEMKSENSADSWINGFAGTFGKYNAFEFVQAEMAFETKNQLNSNEEINIVSIEAEQYKAEEFAQADISLEIDNWMYLNSESDNKAIGKYNATDFVQTEMTHEINSWMNNN